MCTNFFHQQTSSLFTTSLFNSINNSPPRLSPPLLLDPTLFPTDFNNKNHQPISPPPAIILQPFILSHWLPPPLIPTTTLPFSGTHLHIPPTPLSTHTTYQLPRTSKNIILQFGLTTATSTSKYPATSSASPNTLK